MNICCFISLISRNGKGAFRNESKVSGRKLQIDRVSRAVDGDWDARVNK
jgi:hypothetical protein